MLSVLIPKHVSADLRALFISIGLLALVFELPIVAIVQHTLKSPEISWLIHPATLLISAIIATCRPENLGVWSRALFLLLAIYASGIILSASFMGSEFIHAAPLVWLGSVLMGGVIIVAQRKKDLEFIALALFISIAIWSLIFSALYFWDWSVLLSRYGYLKDFQSVSGIVANSKYPGEWVDYAGTYYYRYSGNANKMSNILLLALTVGAFLHARRVISTGWFAALCAPMLFLVAVSGSRAALLFCFILGCGIALWRHRYALQGRAIYLAFAVPMLVHIALIDSQHLLDNSSVLERAEVLSQAANENSFKKGVGEAHKLPRNAADANSHGPSLLLGYGPGNFGPTIGRSPEAGTHLLLVDAWGDGGILSAASLTLFFALPIWLGARKGTALFQDHYAFFGLIGLSLVMALGMREYSLVYMFSQATSAVLPALFVAMILSSDQVD